MLEKTLKWFIKGVCIYQFTVVLLKAEARLASDFVSNILHLHLQVIILLILIVMWKRFKLVRITLSSLSISFLSPFPSAGVWLTQNSSEYLLHTALAARDCLSDSDFCITAASFLPVLTGLKASTTYLRWRVS